jgi:hypothetical protein
VKVSHIVFKNRFLSRITAGALVVAVASGAALLLGGVATAAPPPGSLGSLGLTPATGTDLDNPTVTTSAGCPNTADQFNVVVTGPNGFNTPVITTSDVGISFTGPFSAKFGQDMKDAAAEQGKTLVAGEYDVSLRCVDGLTGDVKGNFTTAMNFSSPTAYTSAGPTPTPGTHPHPDLRPEPHPHPHLEPHPHPDLRRHQGLRPLPRRS